MWFLWEARNDKFSVVCEMREMDPCKMCESKEGDAEVERVEKLCEEVETVRDFCYFGIG